ncbi:hypothetical protein Z951_20310 [Streptomyces sp. PRh5]|nr:hypothetical protein Z951_20310 [Streptomyces sp. PRh5]
MPHGEARNRRQPPGRAAHGIPAAGSPLAAAIAPAVRSGSAALAVALNAPVVRHRAPALLAHDID